MKLSVAGKQIHVSKAFHDHVKDKLDVLNTKYDINPIDVVVTVAHESHEFDCEVAAHIGREMHIRCRGKGSDAYTSLDSTLSNLERRVKRHKKRLLDHNRKRDIHLKQEIAPSYVLNLNKGEEDKKSDDLSPPIIAEIDRKINTLSVGEAVFRMDLGNENPYIFRNSAHGRVNIVYKREDGNIGWIDIPA